MSENTDPKENPQDDAVESRRNFLKQAGVAGLGVGTASVAGLLGLRCHRVTPMPQKVDLMERRYQTRPERA